MGANSDIRIAIAGLRIKGAQHIDIFGEIPGVRIVALCDPDDAILNREVERIEKNNGKVDKFRDIRNLLERKDIDALVIATPNHWHALMAVWACQAGKDVYVEKPVSHNIWEGRKIIEAGRRYDRIVQAGTQHRSDEGLREAMEYVWQGNLGKIRLVRGFCYRRRQGIGRVGGPRPIPASIDYDLYYDWHWFWDTGNGEIGNQGPHEVDMCRWALREKGLPKRVFSMGGRYIWDDDGETPNTQISLYEYETPIVFEVRNLPRSKDTTAMDAFRGIRTGIVLECENGYFAGGEGGGWAYDAQGRKIKQFVGSGVKPHAANFIQAVRSRKRDELRADIEVGHVSSALVHLANISYRLGQSAPQAELQKALAADAAVSEQFQAIQEHLRANGVDPVVAPAVQGARLDVLPGEERFASREKYDMGFWANRMLGREYRPPFVVPEKV
jgi:predicted dehydrogenase